MARGALRYLVGRYERECPICKARVWFSMHDHLVNRHGWVKAGTWTTKPEGEYQ